jgi:long-chain acyl-CoA synthetase
MNISEMLTRNARNFPDNIALIEHTHSVGLRKQITWSQLDERVNRIANSLITRGIKKGDRVLHWMMNSINWIEAYFGIVRTGAWAVPLNYRFSSQDLKYCTDAAEPRMMILDNRFVQEVKAVTNQNLGIKSYIVTGRNPPHDMEGFEDIISESVSDPVMREIRDEDPCGLYFTSGTTGMPKPILLTHKNMECGAITEVVHGLRKPDDIFIILKPLYHTGDKIHWLGSLILGGPAVIQCGKITPQAIFAVIAQERGTVAMLLVPWIHDILTALDNGELKKKDYDLSCWRLVLLGAQPVPSSLVKRWKEKFPFMEYELNYGLTEAAGPGCIHLGIGNEHKLGSIGKAGFNWDARIVSETGKDAAPGEIGEIIVKGNGIMEGYYKNPEKTAESIKDGWLYTGDMGKMDSDGFIWLVDRKRDVIICGGENVYPAEIENVLQSHHKIHDAAVIGLQDDRLGEIVVAIIQLEANALETIEQELSIFCEENFQRYKRPRRIIFDKVLRNPTGKIEKLKMKERYLK